MKKYFEIALPSSACPYALIQELVDLKKITKLFPTWKFFCQDRDNQLKSVYNSVRIFCIFWFAEPSRLFKIIVSYLSSMRVDNMLDISLLHIFNLTVVTVWDNTKAFFMLSCWFWNRRISLTSSGQSFFHQASRVVCCAVRFTVFTVSNRVLLLPCI